MSKAIVTGIGIVYNTKFEHSPGHYKGRVGSPLIIQEQDMPDKLRDQILALAQKCAEKYWGLSEESN